MDLVDEKDVVLLEVREDRRQVAGALHGRAGSDAHGDAHLRGDDVGQRRLAEAGRTVKQDVVEGLVALAGGVDGDAEVVLELGLADEFVEAPGPQRRVQRLIIVLHLAGSDALGRRRAAPSLLTAPVEYLCY